MEGKRLTYPTAKSFIDMYKAADEPTKTLILGILLHASATANAPKSQDDGDKVA